MALSLVASGARQNPWILDPYFLTNFRSQTELGFPNMRIPSNHLPSGKSELLKAITNHLRSVQGVQAIVLGGSHARGTARDDSDLDIGIYYAEQHGMVLDGIRDLAQVIALPEKPPTVTTFINGDRGSTAVPGYRRITGKLISSIRTAIRFVAPFRMHRRGSFITTFISIRPLDLRVLSIWRRPSIVFPSWTKQTCSQT